jgi:hypothetical protein
MSAVEAPGGLVDRACSCGQCGLTVQVQTRYWGRPRQYAPDCPVRELRLRESNRESARRAYERVRVVRRCHCGCGRVLPPRVWYHPDCLAEGEAEAERVERLEVEKERPGAPERRCGCCYGMSWRRHPVIGCGRCGAPYAPETVRRESAGVPSGLGLIEEG